MVFLQSDVQDVTENMVRQFAMSPLFDASSSSMIETESPFPVQTDREELTLGQNKPVYRALFSRNTTPYKN